MRHVPRRRGGTHRGRGTRRRSAHLLDSVVTLLRRHLTPLLAQLIASFRRHLPEAVEGLADLLLTLGGQCFVLLPALTQQLPLLGRHGTPLREALLRAGALLRRH